VLRHACVLLAYCSCKERHLARQLIAHELQNRLQQTQAHIGQSYKAVDWHEGLGRVLPREGLCQGLVRRQGGYVAGDQQVRACKPPNGGQHVVKEDGTCCVGFGCDCRWLLGCSWPHWCCCLGPGSLEILLLLLLFWLSLVFTPVIRVSRLLPCDGEHPANNHTGHSCVGARSGPNRHGAPQEA